MKAALEPKLIQVQAILSIPGMQEVSCFVHVDLFVCLFHICTTNDTYVHDSSQFNKEGGDHRMRLMAEHRFGVGARTQITSFG